MHAVLGVSANLIYFPLPAVFPALRRNVRLNITVYLGRIFVA